MDSNSFGKAFRITTFGESHGQGIGVIIDGCPAGLAFDEGKITKDLQRRKPGQSRLTTQRKEDEEFQVLSGVFEGKTTGMPIAILIPNKDVKSKDYEHLRTAFRPNHADYTYHEKYGIRDYRGGGRSSARETANWVAAGAVAKMLLSTLGISIQAFVSSVGEVEVPKEFDFEKVGNWEENTVRCPHPTTAEKMEEAILQTRKEGDTLGGEIFCVIKGVPAGLGEPIFDKLHARLGQALLTINAVKGFEYGLGFKSSKMKGSVYNDLFTKEQERVVTKTNHSGGIQGGISNGMPIYCKVAFKPVATVMKDQESISDKGEKMNLKGKGRHDPCVVPRAVPIVEAMAALVLADFVLLSRLNTI